MRNHTFPPPTEPGAAIPVSRRHSLATLIAIVRNPIEATPAECFHEPLVAAPLFGRPRLYLCDPVLIHEAYVRNADRLSKGVVVPRVLGPAFGNGLLSADGAQWRHQRRAAAPAFAHEKLLACLPAMIAAAEATRDGWLASGGVVDINHAMTATTFAIIADTMLSGAGAVDAARFEHHLATYLGATGWLAGIAMVGLPASTPFPGRRRAMAAAKWLRTSVGSMVAERRATQNGGHRQDLVSLLLAARDIETGAGLDDAEVTDNLLTFIAAGHETTAQGLAWTLRLLADEPNVEAEVLAEIEAVTEGEPLRPEHVARLDFVRRVFSESMRLYPPAPVIERRVEHAMVIGGHGVAAGTILVVPIHALHRRAGLWKDPLRFDPSRFAPEHVETRHRYGYMPFGAGPRSCIGAGFSMLEGVAILAVLLRAVRPSAVESIPSPRMRITLRPSRPIRMRVAPRLTPRAEA